MDEEGIGSRQHRSVSPPSPFSSSVSRAPSSQDLELACSLVVADPVFVLSSIRGGVVDEPALFDALKSGHLYSAGIDVFPNEPEVNPEYFKYDNICTFSFLPRSSISSV